MTTTELKNLIMALNEVLAFDQFEIEEERTDVINIHGNSSNIINLHQLLKNSTLSNVINLKFAEDSSKNYLRIFFF